MWHKVYTLIDDSPALRKESQTWGTDYKRISYFLEDNMARIERDMRKQFRTEYAKVRYFSAIIKNGIANYIMPKPEIAKDIGNEFYEMKYKPKARRKCLADYEECMKNG